MTRRNHSRAWLLGPLAIVTLTMLVSPGAGAADPADLVGLQGTDTRLPSTDSAVTVNGRGQFSSLAITVNQTENLVNQAVSVTWTGGTPTIQSPVRYSQNFVQVMQCWGDDDGAVPGNPGPPPEQCVQGTLYDVGGGYNGLYPGAAYVTGRIISFKGSTPWPNYEQSAPNGFLDQNGKEVWLPFRSVTGTVVNAQYNTRSNGPSAADYWQNSFYNLITTNEIFAASTSSDGRGAELFQVNTGRELPGLGCGQQIQPVADGGKKRPQCWIVVVPRGSAFDENQAALGAGYCPDPVPADTPDPLLPGQYREDTCRLAANQRGVVTSPLSPAAWANRIAIPIEFTPIDSPCAFAADERRLVGNEMSHTAISSWQPVLCAGGGLPPFSYAPVGDPAARQQFRSSVGAPGMAVISRPLSETADPVNPVVYAPITASGITIAFNVERTPTATASGVKLLAPAAANAIAGQRVAEINLTPRLIAKLLTQSYGSQVKIAGSTPDYDWLSGNPVQMASDPDFLRFNPEFQILDTSSRPFGGLQLPAGNTDAAREVWEWVLADPEASAWLSGQPDEWGMKVNVVYSTVASANPTGVAFTDPVPSSFPKADPYCYQGPQQGENAGVPPFLPPKLCGTDWMPYNLGFRDAARITRFGDDTAKINLNDVAPSPDQVWKREAPQKPGSRTVLSVTDTPSATRFGLQTARLSRAGDNGADRSFIAPTTDTLTAGVAAMRSDTVSEVLEPDPTVSAPGAYPLTSLSYAVIRPLSLDAQARADYAAFLEYAAGAGQIAGSDPGQLPAGYVPLSASLQTQTVQAAATVRTMTQPVTTTTAPPPAPSTEPGAQLPGASTPQGSSDESPQGSSGATPSRSTPRSNGGSSAGGPTVTETSLAPEDTVATTVDESDVSPTSIADVDQSATTTTTVVRGARALTPASDLANGRFVVAGAGALALSSALGALEITKRSRRSTASDVGIPALEQIDGP